jgi:hypothetical protein
MTTVNRESFDLAQLALMNQALQRSEALVAGHYRIPALPSRQYPYEVVTLAELAGPERAPDALAHLVVYERPRPGGPEPLYRICLQDDRILERCEEEDGEWLSSLLIYILTHELVHVVRFQRAEESFGLEEAARQREEDRVHTITLELLRAACEPRWARLDQLYGNPVIPVQVVPRRGPTDPAGT